MFRLKATLVARTVLRPWRTGWSVDRGVDFSLPARTGAVIAPPATYDEVTAAEPACFIDEDWAVPLDAAVRTFVSSAAPEAVPDAAPDDANEAAGLRAWWSLTGKA